MARDIFKETMSQSPRASSKTHLTYRKNTYMNIYALPLIFLFAFAGGYIGTTLAIKIELWNAKKRDEWKARKAYLDSQL